MTGRMAAILLLAALVHAGINFATALRAEARATCVRPTGGAWSIFYTTNGSNICARTAPLNPPYCPAP